MSSQSSTQWRGERYTHNHTDQTHTHPPPISRFSCGLFSSLFSFLSYDYWVSFFLWFIAQELDVQRLGNFFALFSVLLLLFGWVILIGTYCWCQFGCCSVEFLVGWGFWIPVFFFKMNCLSMELKLLLSFSSNEWEFLAWDFVDWDFQALCLL